MNAEEGTRAPRPLRVMHFVAYYPPQRIGGVGELVAGLHEGLLRRGHDSQVVTSGSGSSGRVHRIARTRLGWLLGTLLWARRAAACDVVHCQSGEAALVLLVSRLLRARRGRRARGVVTFHAGSRDIARATSPYTLAGRRFSPRWAGRVSGLCRGLLHGLLNRLALRLADGCNAIARATAEAVAPGAGLAVIYNGVAAAEGSGAALHSHGATLEAAGAGAPLSAELLFVGGPGPGKRALALPFVLRDVRRRHPRARLCIAGFGWEEAPELRALCQELAVLEAVECMGSQPRDALGPLYQSARLLLVPSAYEGLPFVALESMLLGTPVVACRVGGLPEAITSGENGVLVQPDDPEALAAHCSELLADPTRTARMSAAGRDTVSRRFGLERCIDEHLDYYRALAREET